MKIQKIHARQILDSRGNPTVECDVFLENGSMGRAAVPSGASTGTNEAVELRDGDASKYLGKGVLKAVANVNDILAKEIVGMDASDQKTIDSKLIELDGTPTKSRLGANALLAVSLAVAKANAVSSEKPFFASLQKNPLLPLPMMNVINGGRHADFATDIQEFMIMPVGASSFSQCLQMGTEVFHHLKKVLKAKGYDTTVGDEGGFAPRVKNGNAEALDLLTEAVKNAGYTVGTDIVFALDVASSEFMKDGKYSLQAEKKTLTTQEMITWLSDLVSRYPIVSIEDGLAESDWDGWIALTKTLGGKIQLVGDDLLVTNKKFLEKAINEKACNAILIKPNQIGTLTETIEAVEMAQKAGFTTVMSHRSGETEDTTIAHLAVGLATGQIKTGSLSRTDRVAKYNELLRIEEIVGSDKFKKLFFF